MAFLRHVRPIYLSIMASSLVFAAPAGAELPSDYGAGPTSARLAMPASKHWVWINDLVFAHMADGAAHLVDGDSGRYLGTLSTGFGFTRVVLARDGKVIYSPETYFSRGTRGTRTDVVSVYDAATLGVIGEIPIPPKRASNFPAMGDMVLTDDGRFLLIFNFTPSSSVTVVDTTTRKFIGEIETPGCALIYPTGPRSFFTLCGDGSAQLITLSDKGAVAKQNRTLRLFDVDHDPVTEKPVRVAGTWYFVSFDGRIYPMSSTKEGLTVGTPWWLSSEAERKLGWRPGGLQQLAAHAGQNRLYAIMHQGNRDTHKDPGKVIWVFDLSTRARVLEIPTRNLTGSIQISTDNKPLLYGAFADSSILDIYDATTGRPLRAVKDVGATPTLLVVP